MTKYSKRSSLRNHHPDLFDWASERELRHSNCAARWIAERYGIPIHTAAVMARLAGIGPERLR